jgi:uncharacterized protein
MTKPIGPMCNLDCTYCYYLEKEKLYPPDEQFRMSDQVLETYVKQYIASQDQPEVVFAWQGGEPTLLGVDFFRKAVAFQQAYADGKRISNALQTNGTLLDDAWGTFLAEHNFLIGLSVDGPAGLHDAYRVDKRRRPSFDQVMRGLEVLKRHQVEFNTLTVVNRKNSRDPLAVYRFLKDIGSGFLQFIPLVERRADASARRIGLDLALPPDEDEEASSPVTPWSVESKQYGEFLVTIFEEWVRRDVGKVFVQLFDIALAKWAGSSASLCVFAETCGDAMVLEHNGDLFSCDHYVYPRYKLGNIVDRSLGDLASLPAQWDFGNAKLETLPRYCRECPVRFACNGECPKHRFIDTPEGEPGLNYLCAGYKRFFTHVAPYMETMAKLLAARRPPAEIMALVARRDREQQMRTVKRNDPCPCGSGKKFKHCCGAK